MPAFNAEEYIGQAIQSVLSQDYSHWELIIVNDGSTDGTEEVIKKFNDPRIKVFSQVNRGEAAARNTALRHLRGEFVAFLDSDDLFYSNHLKVAVLYLQTHHDKDGVYTDGYYCDQNGTLLKTLSSRRRGPFTGRVYEEAVRGSDLFGPPVCVVLRSNIIIQNNLQFDENIIIGPDWDFFIQYANLAQFGYLDQITCIYRVHLTNITFRIGLQKRALEMAKCRMKAIQMKGFSTCSLEIRSAVFYDLLVNLLRGYPERQTEITYWKEFLLLPKVEQAKLLRLMASKSVLYQSEGNLGRYIKRWLTRSLKINPADWKSILLYVVFSLSPNIFIKLLRIRTSHQIDPQSISPFADLFQV